MEQHYRTCYTEPTSYKKSDKSEYCIRIGGYVNQHILSLDLIQLTNASILHQCYINGVPSSDIKIFLYGTSMLQTWHGLSENACIALVSHATLRAPQGSGHRKFPYKSPRIAQVSLPTSWNVISEIYPSLQDKTKGQLGEPCKALQKGTYKFTNDETNEYTNTNICM